MAAQEILLAGFQTKLNLGRTSRTTLLRAPFPLLAR